MPISELEVQLNNKLYNHTYLYSWNFPSHSSSLRWISLLLPLCHSISQTLVSRKVWKCSRVWGKTCNEISFCIEWARYITLSCCECAVITLYVNPEVPLTVQHWWISLKCPLSLEFFALSTKKVKNCSFYISFMCELTKHYEPT